MRIAAAHNGPGDVEMSARKPVSDLDDERLLQSDI